MEIQTVNSGQDGMVARQWAEMSALLHETAEKYPGLLGILKDPYGSLYLKEGMYQKAIRFLEDCVERNNGKIDLAVVYAPKSLEANLMRLTLGRLVPGCDETRPEGYLSVLEARGAVTEMYKGPNWDAHVINKEMIEMLWKNCADTAEKIDTNALSRFPEKHKWGMCLVGESIMGFGYGCVLYYATIAEQSQPRRQNAEVEEKEEIPEDVVKTESNAGGEVEAAGESGIGTSWADLMSPEDAAKYNNWVDLREAGLDQAKINDIILTNKGYRPNPATYLSQEYINAHLEQFSDGTVKISATTPIGQAGPPGGTFVMPKSVADEIIREANGDVLKLEQLLSLEPGTLGDSPVRLDIVEPQDVRMPSGNELGANNQWIPGGRTGGGIPEAVIDSPLQGEFESTPIFE